MTLTLLTHATGLAALAFNISGLVKPSDSGLRTKTGFASGLWALNNLLLGADTAAALNFVSAGRQAAASVVQGQAERAKLALCATFALFTVLVGIVTWDGPSTLLTMSGSLLATYAMFYMRGAPLRWAMCLVSVLWVYNAIAFNSWEQLIANLVAGGAAAYGAWKASRNPLAGASAQSSE